MRTLAITLLCKQIPAGGKGVWGGAPRRNNNPPAWSAWVAFLKANTTIGKIPKMPALLKDMGVSTEIWT